MATATLSEQFTGDLAVPRYELEAWSREYGVVAGLTGREGGFDLSLWSEGSVGCVMTRWRAFRTAVGSRFGGMVLSHQRHGIDLRYYAERVRGMLLGDGVDGHITRLEGLLLAVTVADCIPVYLVHHASGTVGLLHAGWRGTASGILERGIQTICEVAGCHSSDLVMHCGVGICGDCYEVGPDVIRDVTGRTATEPGPLDLRAALAARAKEQGVRHITTSGWCSGHDGDRFYSYRGSGGTAGRMVAYLGRPVT